MYKKMFVATDGSELSHKAVGSAIDMAALHGAELYALKVIPRVQQSFFEGATSLGERETKHLLATWRHDAENLLNVVVAAGKQKGVTVKPVVMSSDLVAETIVKTAEECKSELIVMASHGRRGIKRLLLGSETSNVLAHSSIPVLVVR
jgi:nucleotide-binding universal stress UspA family protein